MAPRINSAIGMTLAGKTASVDIPKARDGAYPAGRDTFTAVPVDGNIISTKKPHGVLPTPPSSISPNLPPRRHPRDVRAYAHDSPPTVPEEESDMDLPDAVEHRGHNATAPGLNADSLGDLDSAGAITPAMLAKHHLPEILLAHGPLAIRHVMGYLTTSVPGFSRISSAKARRLVVAALEGRGGGGVDGGGVDGDVVFDKVGWGCWDARVKGQPPRDRQTGNVTPPGSLPSSYSQGGIPIAGRRWPSGSDQLGTSVTHTATFTRSEMDDDDHDMLEHEADKMSLDGDDDGYASSEAPEPLMDEDLGEGDVTDEEDWATMGAAALRARSLPSNGVFKSGGGHLYQPVATFSRHRSRTPGIGHLATTAPSKAPNIPSSLSAFALPPGVGLENSQERAAIEALLSLGSM